MIIQLTHVTQTTLRGLKEYTRAEGVLAELGVALESETAEYCEKIPHTSARSHVDLVPGGNVTGTRLMRADT
jgi:hypothetical protein